MTWGEEFDQTDQQLREGIVIIALRDLGWIGALFLTCAALGTLAWLIADLFGILTLAVLVVGALGFALALPGWIDE